MSPKAANLIQSLLNASEAKNVQRFTGNLAELDEYITKLEAKAEAWDKSQESSEAFLRVAADWALKKKFLQLQGPDSSDGTGKVSIS